jgi:hypothetical protein
LLKRNENWSGGTFSFEAARYETLTISNAPTITHPKATPDGELKTIKFIVDHLHFEKGASLTTEANLQIRAKKVSPETSVM